MADHQITTLHAVPAAGEGTPLVAAPYSAPDELLVAAAQAGDARAFDELVSRHAGRVYGLVARLLGDRTAAEDVAQEAFVRAWRGLASFRGEARFSTWLYRSILQRWHEQRRVTAKTGDETASNRRTSAASYHGEST